MPGQTARGWLRSGRHGVGQLDAQWLVPVDSSAYGSLLTPRWREADSNHRSRCGGCGVPRIKLRGQNRSGADRTRPPQGGPQRSGRGDAEPHLSGWRDRASRDHAGPTRSWEAVPTCGLFCPQRLDRHRALIKSRACPGAYVARGRE
jgi:hypothetical protein